MEVYHERSRTFHLSNPDGSSTINGITGVRYARGCNPSDLWTTYFTSSSYVQKFREEHGEPDVVEIRQTFLSKVDSQQWEDKVLRRLGAVKSERWLNRCRGGKHFNNQGGYTLKEETKRKMQGRQISNQQRMKQSESLKGKMRYTDQNGNFIGWFLKNDPQIKEQNLKIQWTENNQKQIENRLKKATEVKLGSKTYNNGTDEIKRKEHPGEGWILGRLPRSEEHHQNQTNALRQVRQSKIVYNDGIKNFYIDSKTNPDPHWIKGMRPRG